MKNIITAIAIMFISFGVNAQTVFRVKVDSFYNFKFDKNLSASEALNDNKFIELPGHVGKTDIIVNEMSETIIMKFDGMTYTLNMLGHPNGNKDAYIYEYKDGDKMVRGQMSFVYGSAGGRYVLAESQDENPNYTKACIAKIK